MNLEEARRAKAEAEQLVRTLENQEYMDNDFATDLDELLKTCKYGLEKEDLPLREKMQQAIAEVKKVNQAYSESLWPKDKQYGSRYC